VAVRPGRQTEERNAKLKAEKDARYEEIIDAYNKFEELRTQFVNDYGYFTFNSEYKNGDSHDWFWNLIGVF
jgi:hypothetical protein